MPTKPSAKPSKSKKSKKSQKSQKSQKTKQPQAKSPSLEVKVHGDTLQIGDLSVTFHRTLRIPDDGHEYPLPPSLGAFPLHRVDDYRDRVPASWLEHGGVFLPMYQREAMWLSFSSRRYWRPQALKIAVGMVDAVSGRPWSEQLDGEEQDYLVVPEQPWLDGINAGDGFIKQFVAMPLGMGYTVEGQLTGEEKFGGVQLLVFDPKEGKFTEPKFDGRLRRGAGGQMTNSVYALSDASEMAGMADVAFAAAGPESMLRSSPLPKGAEMGLGAGGRMRQQIYPDSHGLDTWDLDKFGRVYVHLVNSMMYREITGLEPPETPVSAQTYASHGYPWFDLYDEHLGDVQKSEILEGVKSVKEMDEEKGFEGQQDDSSFEVPSDKIVKYGMPDGKVRDGEWG